MKYYKINKKIEWEEDEDIAKKLRFKQQQQKNTRKIKFIRAWNESNF